MISRWHAGVALGLMALSFGCGGSDASRVHSVQAQQNVAPPSEELGGRKPLEVPFRYTGRIARGDLVPILDQGLGQFLRGVETQAAMQSGKFLGFRLVSFYPKDPQFQGLDLKKGDIITRINGQPLHNPDDAAKVWKELYVASELVIDYERDSEPRTLRFEIVDN